MLMKVRCQIVKILQLSVNSTDESESSGDLKMDLNSRRNRAFPLTMPTYIPGKACRYKS